MSIKSQEAYLNKVYSLQMVCPSCGETHSYIDLRGNVDWMKPKQPMKCPNTGDALNHCMDFFGNQWLHMEGKKQWPTFNNEQILEKAEDYTTYFLNGGMTEHMALKRAHTRLISEIGPKAYALWCQWVREEAARIGTPVPGKQKPRE